MLFNKIEEIRVGGHSKGIIESDGNVFAIISANYEQNYDKSPSKLSLTVIGVDSSNGMMEYLGINENGDSITGGKQDETFSMANMETIYVAGVDGEQKNVYTTIFDFTGFLISFSETISAGERQYQLEYIDRSVILDKIFVGLTNRHQEVNNLVSGYADASALCGERSLPRTTRIYFGTKNGLGPKLNTARQYNPDTQKSFIPYFPLNAYEYFAGGRIIVGDEQYQENFCSIPPVDYSFKDLIDGMSSAGIPITKHSGRSFSGLSASGKGLRREYSGTLRTVLSSWCSEYGLFYIWDETAGTSKDGTGISFYDMREGVGNIHALKNRLLKVGVEDLTYSTTKENSQFKNLVTRMIKPPSITEKTINFSVRVPCRPVTLNDIDQRDVIERPNDANAFLTSCALAKANPDLRTLWYMSETRSNHTMRWEALGLYVVKDKGGNTFYRTESKGNILKSVYIEEYSQIAADFNVENESGFQAGGGKDNCDLFLVYKSDDMESRFLDWEKNIADNFIGKYWRSKYVSSHPDTSTCASLYGRRGKIADSNPPFIDISDEVIPEITMDPYGGIISSRNNYIEQSTLGVSRLVKRDSAQWGTSLVIDGEKEIKNITPRFVPVTIEHYDVLMEAGIIEDDVELDFSMGGAKFQLGFLFVRKDLSKKVKFTSRGRDANPMERTDSEINAFNSEGDINDCKPNCSVDIAEVICGDNSQNGSNLQPAILNNLSFSITVSGSFGISGTVYTPVGAKSDSANFDRIETINYTNYLSRSGLKHFKNTLMEKDQPGPLQAASIDVVEEDMSNGILFSSSTNGNNTVIDGSSYVVWDGIGTNMGIVRQNVNFALEKYHQGIQNTIPTSSLSGGESLTATLTGNMFSALREEFALANGLSALSFSFGSSGSTTKISFRSIPKETVSKELVIPIIKTLTAHFRN